MNDKQYTALSGYIQQLADALLLRDWEITLKRDGATEGNYAQIWVCETENLGTIRVHYQDFFTGIPEDQREWIVHELLHCHLARPAQVMEQLTEQFSDNSASEFAKGAYRNREEIAVQTLARILAPHLPLPPKLDS